MCSTWSYDECELYDDLELMKPAADHILREMHKLQVLKDMQQELVAALVERTCQEKERLLEVALKEQELLSALRAVEEPEDAWKLWMYALGGVLFTSLLCYNTGIAGRTSFLNKLADCTQDSCLCPEPSLFEKLMHGVGGYTEGVVDGLVEIGCGVVTVVANAPSQ